MSTYMNLRQLLEKAEVIVGGTRALVSRLGWSLGAASEFKNGKRPIPAWRAVQLARIVGEDELSASYAALRDGAGTAEELEFWTSQLKGREKSGHAPGVDERNIVRELFGEKYSGVIDGGVRMYIAYHRHGEAAKYSEVVYLLRKAKVLYDAYEDVFSAKKKLPIDTRRDLICMFLNDDPNVFDLIETFQAY